MRKFVVNEKEYVAKPFDFNMICDLEDCGFDMSELGNKMLKAARAYFAICSGLTPEQAGKEIEQHVIHGGNLTGVMDAMRSEMDASDFFRALLKGQEAEAQEIPREA